MYCYVRFSLAVLLFVGMLCSLGCSGGYEIPEASSADIARETLTAALDAWKAGSDTQSLADSANAVYVGDEDWSRGDRLTEYVLVDQGEPFGTNIRFLVDLTTISSQGTSSQKRARYIVGTSPVKSVKRDDNDELNDETY